MSNDTRMPDNARDDGLEVHHQRISVPFEFPVCFARNVFDAANPLLASTLAPLGERRRHRAAVYVDEGVASADPGLTRRIKEYFHARPGELELAGGPQVVPGGPAVKGEWGTVREVMWTLGNLHLDRQSYVVAVGGGSMLDMIGFAVSIVHRGLRLVRLPSTTLAQDDAGVGVKTGMDEHGQKNFVGTFAPPFAVINDFELLRTLPQEHWIGGVAEALKVAIITDADFFAFLRDKAPALRGRDQAVMEETVRRCAILHLRHTATSGDPFEFGSARPLDFGHWSAHRIEMLTGYRIGHGQAVAIGIALDACYAARKGLLRDADRDAVLDALETAGLPTWDDCLKQRADDGTLEVLAGLDQFREHLGGALTVTLPDGIGRKVEVHQMSADWIEEAVSFLHQRSRTPAPR